MLNYQFQKSVINTKDDDDLKETLINYTNIHMPDLEFLDFKTSYSVRTFIFKMLDPAFARSYKSANIRSIFDAVMDVNGTNTDLDGNKLIVTVPRTERETMYLGNGIEYLATVPKESDITCYIGENASGEPVTIDIEKEVHLLIAGQTGSGKSTCIHDIIMSLLSRYEPDELLFYMIDPKSDLIRYEKLPSVMEAVDDKASIVVTLESIINIMRKRQDEMKSMKLADWNKKYPDKAKPHIIVIFDEIDSIIGKSYNDAKSAMIRNQITQIVKQGRSSGIHLILASQRPVKANLDTSIKSEIKARIALKLDTPTDSRIMLNQRGAESLIGNGDAYMTTGGTPERIQVAFASYDEIDAAIASMIPVTAVP